MNANQQPAYSWNFVGLLKYNLFLIQSTFFIEHDCFNPNEAKTGIDKMLLYDNYQKILCVCAELK